MLSVFSIDMISHKLGRAVLFSDSKNTTPANPTGADVDSIRDDVEFAEGSMIITGDFNAAFKKSDGSWNWKE